MLSLRLAIACAVVFLLGGIVVEGRVPLVEDQSCAGDHPACHRPLAVTILAGQWHTASVPSPTFRELADECALPRATCVRPFARTVQQRTSSVCTPTVQELLHGWEQVAVARSPVSARDRAWLIRQHDMRLSAHAVDVAIQCLGPVTTAALEHEFRWTLAAREDGRVVLHGVPVDEAHRLFCAGVRVDVDQTSGTVEVQVAQAGSWVTVIVPERMPDSATILLTAYESAKDHSTGLPPAPAPQRLASDPTPRPAVR